MIEIGEYGRTNTGKIFIFAQLEEDGIICKNKILIRFENKWTNYYFGKDENIVKQSKNLIDLIEVGDIVHMVDVLNDDYIYIYNEEMLKAVREDIEQGLRLDTILTKEMYEQNCYKVGVKE